MLRPMTPAALTRTVGTAAAGAGRVSQLVRFGLVGGAASGLQLALYAFLAGSLGAQPATVVSWLVSTLVATEAHRRYSFPAGAHAVAGRTGGAESDHLVGLLTSVATLGVSMIALAVLDDPTGAAGVLALVVVNAGVGLLRFVSLRWWLLGRRTPSGIGGSTR